MNRHNVGLIARREVVERARQTGYVVSTAISALIILALAVVPALVDDGPSTYDVGLVGAPSEALAPAIAPPSGSDSRYVTRVLDRGAAEAAVRDGDLDAAVVDGTTVVVDEDLDPELGAVLDGAVRTAGGAAPSPSLQLQALDPPDEDRQQREGLVRIGVFLLYGQIFGYGFYVALGMVEEKSSRVVEVMLSKVRPAELLAAKVLGIGLLGLGQMLLLVGVGLGGALVAGSIDAPPGLLGAVVQVLFWFVLGYAFYSCAFAVAGAVASSQEELQNSASPLTFVLMAAFVTALIAGGNPEGIVATVGSFVPISAPLVMPLRAAAGAAAWWEVVLSVVLVVAATVALIPVAGRVYTGAALRTRSQVKLKEAWRAAA